jgi:hypothetical protein
MQDLGFTENPFGSYTAETEPNIEKYAVKPPYFGTVTQKALQTKSFILFGHRGSGKSATRLTIYKEIWKNYRPGSTCPLPVDFTDFEKIAKTNNHSAADLIDELTFKTIETLLTWLSALKDDDRNIFTEGLDALEHKLLMEILNEFYLSRSEFQRNLSATDALKILDLAWSQRTTLWIQKKWSALSALMASIANGLAKQHLGTDGNQSESIRALLYCDKGSIDKTSIVVINKLVEIIRSFGFSGITILVDKIDETSITNNSVDATATLVYPLLGNIQLLEIDGFGIQFYVWDKIKEKFQLPETYVRMDKIANASISWDRDYLKELINQRLIFYSNKKILSYHSLFASKLNPDNTIEELIELSLYSPRDLIKLLDTIIREHNQTYSESTKAPLLDQDSIDKGSDIFALEKATERYNKIDLNQLCKLSLLSFINRDVQTAFKIESNSATTKINKWIDLGIVTRTGTRASGDGKAGKPANEYGISDTRVARIVKRKLIQVKLDED